MTKAELMARIAFFDNATQILISDMSDPFLLTNECIELVDGYRDADGAWVSEPAIHIGVPKN